MNKISCVICGKEFFQGTRKKYCSRECAKQYQKTQYEKNNLKLEVCSATVGTIGELRVSTDLLIRGFDVYRSLSPACKADLVVLKEKKLVRVEVTTGYLDYKGNVINNKKYADQSNFDVVAVVFTTGEIKYFPDIESVWGKNDPTP